MTTRGKNVRLYLAGDGVKLLELVGWSGQAVSCPRSRFEALKAWERELKRPGVYMLFGVDEATQQPVAYIGESDEVLTRLSQHVLKGLDYWTEIAAFSSKDELLTKAHVQYLEHRLVAIASAAARYKLQNDQTPQPPYLPRADKDALEDFVDNVQTLLPVLGHRLLEPVAQQVVVTPAGEAVSHPTGEGFTFTLSGVTARGARSEGGFAIFKGSQAAAQTTTSLHAGYLRLRQQLIDQGVLVAESGGAPYRFAKDYEFKSPSAAAGIVAGYNRTGRESWVTDDGRTYAEVEAAEATTGADGAAIRLAGVHGV